MPELGLGVSELYCFQVTIGLSWAMPELGYDMSKWSYVWVKICFS